MEALPGLVWTTCADGTSDFVNRRWCEYANMEAAQALGRGWLAAIHPEDLGTVLRSLDAFHTSSATSEIEARLRRHDDEYRWFLIRRSRLNDDDESHADPRWCWLGVEADETSRGPDGRLRRVVDMLPTQVVLMTPALELEFVNREVVNFYGKSLEELQRWDSSGQVHHTDDLPAVHDLLERLRTEGGVWDHQSRMLRADGVFRWIRSRMIPSRDAQGNIVRYCSVQTDVHDLKRAEDILAGEVRLLEMVALRRPLSEVLAVLSRLVEEIAAGCFCSILVVSPDRTQFRVAAGPSLPDSYNATLEGKALDPTYGPCALAVVRKAPVITVDIQSDPRWAASDWPALMLEQEVRACWSTPIISASDEACGVFSVYRREPVEPTPDDQELIDRFTKIAGIAIDRAQDDESLRASEVELRRAHEQLAVEKRLLEMTAAGRPLAEVLEAVCRFVEEISPECLCGIYPIDWSGPVFKYGVAPSLPPSYIEPIKGWPVSVDKAPCGIAVAENRQVIVVDVETDPIWRGTEYRDHVVSHGLRSVWSTLVRSVDGRIHGSFCIYQRQPAQPTPRHQELISHATHIASIALDRAQADEALMAREAELRRAHAQLAEGQRLSKTGTFTADLQMDRHAWSEEYYRIFEIDPATVPSVSAVRERVHPDDLELFDSEIRRGTEGGEADFTFRIMTPVAGLKYLRGVARLIEHVAGRPIFMGTIQDITQSRLAEDELQQANDYLTEAQRVSGTGSFTWDVRADEHRWSAEIRRTFGFDLDVKVSMGMIHAAVHPDDRADVERVIGGAIQGRDFDLVFRIRTLQAEERYAHVVGHRIAHITDRPVFLGALQDVTDSKVAEAALKASEAELRRANRYLTSAQQLSKTGSWIWDVGSNERQWSEEMFRIYELDPDTPIPGALTRQLTHPEDHPIVDALRQQAVEGRDYDGEFRLLLPSGTVKTIRVVGHLMENGERGPTFIGATQDITDRKLAEEGLDRARRELAHVSRVTALSALTASIAHEVNQPLSGIITNASTCLRLLAADPPDIERARLTAERTIRDGNRAADVIQRLRSLFARRPPASEPLDLNEAVREVLALSSGDLKRARVIVKIDLANDLPTIIGDRVQLQQVLLNLVLNAAEAMRQVDDRRRELSITTLSDVDDCVRLSVRDAGMGAKVEQLSHLFDAFYTTKPEGMGVGLSVSRSIIEAHGGRIWAGRNDGPGLTFCVSLPVTASWSTAIADRDELVSGGAEAV